MNTAEEILQSAIKKYNSTVSDIGKFKLDKRELEMFIGVMEEYRSLPVQGMVGWVKEDDRKPQNPDLVHINYSIGNQKFKTTGFYENGKWYNKDTTPIGYKYKLEWYDESISPLQEDGWTKVEDGLPDNELIVDVCFERNEKFKTGIGFYIRKHTVEYDGDDEDFGEYVEEKNTTYCPEGWYEWNWEYDEYRKLSSPVTHYKHRPSPPAKK